MIIRKAEMEDTKKIDNLLTSLIQDEKKYDDSINAFFFVIGYYENFVNDDDKYLYIAQESDDIVGYIFGKILDKDPTYDGKKALLDALFVKKEYRQKGIARDLVKGFNKWCDEKNIDKIEVNVCSENTNAKKLYESFGFKTVKETMEVNIK